MTTNNRPCIIWGATGHCRVISDILINENVDILHVFDNDSSLASSPPLNNVPLSIGISGLESFVSTLNSKSLCPNDIDFVVAVGGSNGSTRASLIKEISFYGFTPRSIIHPFTFISNSAVLGNFVQLLAGSIVGSNVIVGDNTIINTGASIDHDCKIGKNCHLAPQSVLAGEVTLEDEVFLGTNATILPRLHISKGVTVGAGAVVTKNISANSTVVGNPSRYV